MFNLHQSLYRAPHLVKQMLDFKHISSHSSFILKHFAKLRTWWTIMKFTISPAKIINVLFVLCRLVMNGTTREFKLDAFAA